MTHPSFKASKVPAYIWNKMHTLVLSLQIPAWSGPAHLSALTLTTLFFAHVAPGTPSPLLFQNTLTLCLYQVLCTCSSSSWKCCHKCSTLISSSHYAGLSSESFSEPLFNFVPQSLSITSPYVCVLIAFITIWKYLIYIFVYLNRDVLCLNYSYILNA